MKLTKTILAAGAAVVALAAASQAAAGAFYLQEQSVRGLGRAYSGETADRGAASLWWNPAAIAGTTQNEIYGGVHGLLIDTEVRDTGSTLQRAPLATGLPALPVGGEPLAHKPIQDGLAPNLAGSFSVNDKLALGLSVNAPFNFTTAYRGVSFNRYDALKSRLTTVDVQGTVAYRVNDWLDLGVGVDAVYMDSLLSSALPNPSPLLADGRNELTGDGWDFGWVAGAQLHPSERLTIGASYRSKVEHELDGTVKISGLLGPAAAANTTADGKASFTTPWMAILGARYKVTDKLTLNAQVQRTGWSEFDAIRVNYTGGGLTSIQNYKDVTTGGVGFDYDVTPGFTLRAGVQYDPTPTPDNGRTSRVPDGDRWIYGVGATAALSDSLKLDLGASYIAFQDSTIRRDETLFAGTPLASPLSLRGEATGNGAVLSAGMRYTF